MKTEHDIENMFNESRPALDESSRVHLWSRIEAKLGSARPVVSPFLYTFISRSTMVPIALMLAVLVSTGGVALAAETARPGDLLYPVERAFENVRLKVALSTERKNALIRAYGEERLEELREIIDEETRFRKVDEHSANFSASTTLHSLSVEADVFADTTVVKVELNGETSTFTIEAETRDEIAEAVLDRYPFLTKGQVESSLDIETEDRSSRPKDRGKVELTSKGSVRVGSALTEVLTFIDESEEDDDDTTEFLKEIQAEIEGLNIKIDDTRVKARGPKSRFEWKTDNTPRDESGADRAEMRNGESRVRIEEKDGQVMIDLRSDDDWNGKGDDDRDDRPDKGDEGDDDV